MKIKQTMYVDKGWNDEIRLQGYKGTCDKCLGEVTVEVNFDMPSDIEIRDMSADAINYQIEKVKADTEVTLERLRGEISKLMAIEP